MGARLTTVRQIATHPPISPLCVRARACANENGWVHRRPVAEAELSRAKHPGRCLDVMVSRAAGQEAPSMCCSTVSGLSAAVVASLIAAFRVGFVGEQVGS